MGMNDIVHAMDKAGVDNAFAVAAGIMIEIYKNHYLSPYDIAIMLGHSNKLEDALLWIEKSMEEKDPKVIFLNVDPEWYSLKQNALFLKYVEKAGFKTWMRMQLILALKNLIS